MAAHKASRLFRVEATVPAAIAFALALPAAAIGVGDIQVHSCLGEPLDATVPITTTPGEILAAECFFAGRVDPGGLPALTRLTFTVESVASGPRVRIRTFAAQNEPAMHLRLHASCDGAGAIVRDYAVLLDPRPVTVAPAVIPVALAVPVAVPSPAAATSILSPSAPGLHVMAGDSLTSIAVAIYPRNRAAREAYVEALRNQNPAVSGHASDEPLPEGTVLTLPDLRRFARDLRPRERDASTNRVRAARPAQAAQPPRRRSTADPASPKPKRTARPASGRDFVLRLSSPDLDLSRSRGFDDRTRTQLRERLLLLDTDDQVSAVLAMRSSLKLLEGRVADLQLKLSGVPTFPATTIAPAPVAEREPSTPAPKVASAPAKAPTRPAPDAGYPAWVWGALVLFAVAILAIAMRFARRRHKKASSARTDAHAALRAETRAAMHDAPPDLDLSEATPAEPPAHRFETDSDANLATNVPGADPHALRHRYIEERFPEIVAGTISLDDPDSLVKAARLFYEDGALPRAVELLQFAVDEKPAAMKPWLALFEIFRLEALRGEFAELARRFQEHHGRTDNWRKVQYIGREFDPENPLFRDDAFRSLETIGYPAAKKSAEIAFDPLAENWLNAPMDFTTDALAADLRAGLLADAGIRNRDLIPNPMPALKRVEMFNVA